MKLPKLGKNFAAERRNGSLNAIANVFLAIAVCFLAAKAFWTYEDVVLVPPGLDKKVKVAMDHADEEYYKSFGLYVATLIGNVTPKNVTLVADSVSVFCDARIYSAVRNEILSLADDPVFQRANAINFWAPDKVIFETDETHKHKVFVVGQLITSSLEPAANLNGPRADPKWATYEMTVEMRQRRIWITEFTSYPGTQPHTMKWRASQQATQPKQQGQQGQSQQQQQQESTQ